MSPVGLNISRDDGALNILMPVAPNRWIVGLGFGLAMPWLFLFTAGSIAAPFLVSEDMRRNAILGAIALNLLFLIVHILALMGVWMAFYKLRGTEHVVVTAGQFAVQRRAMGITVPIKLGRTAYDVVEILDPHKTPGRNAHPRLEVRAGHSAVRFGAGLSAVETKRVHDLLVEEFASRP